MSFETLPSQSGILPAVMALFLAGGSLIVYLAGAIVSRLSLGKEAESPRSFNLALPSGRPAEELFAISIVSSATTLSTVFILFLTSAGAMGFHLLLCPVSFCIGTLFMLFVYKRIKKKGYLDDSSYSGLVPYFIFQMTGSKALGYLLLFASVLPLLAILTLEIRYGIVFIDYLVHDISSTVLDTARFFDLTFIIFIIFIVLLLGYVFVGGFRAVVTSDVWQYKTMTTSLTFVLISTVVLAVQRRSNLHWDSLHPPSITALLPFYVEISIINFFTPLCLATTWQRFRAFQGSGTNFSKGSRAAIAKALYLWGILIGIALIFQIVAGYHVPAGQDGFYIFLDEIKAQNDWFRLFVFPMLSVAAFSGMYSSSDTCISALLYLTESGRAWNRRSSSDAPAHNHYRWAILGIFMMALTMYLGVKLAVATGNLMFVAKAIFGDAVIIAPTVFLLTMLEPPVTLSERRSRSLHIMISIFSGLVAYWLCMTVSTGRGLFLRDWSIFVGLFVSTVPAYILARRERSKRKEDRDGRVFTNTERAALR